MTGHVCITRRRFLFLTAALGASFASGPTIPGLWYCLAGRSSPQAVRLVGCLHHRKSARVIGSAYLETVPSEAQIRPLVEAIAAGLEGGPGALRLEENELRKRLARRVARDFEEDVTVCLRGWVVSRTEARLCGLAALL